MSLIVENQHRVLHLTLNRPEKRNALTAGLCSGIVKEVLAAQNRQDVGCILISAAGQVFCSGMDLEEAAQLQAGELEGTHEALFTMGVSSLKPVVICVNGAALGGGLGLVAQGHLVVASEIAVFGLPEVRVGLWPFLVYRSVEAALGARRTLELSLTGRLFHTEDALAWGLVQEISPPGEALERAKSIAQELARHSPIAIAAGMEYVQYSREKTSKEAGELARALRVKVMREDDFKEGVKAFKEKREPRWPSMAPNFYTVEGER